MKTIFISCSANIYVNSGHEISDEGRRQLRFANWRTCVVRQPCSSYGDRCFAAAGPGLWNKFPAYLGQTDINFEYFQQLKEIKAKFQRDLLKGFGGKVILPLV